MPLHDGRVRTTAEIPALSSFHLILLRHKAVTGAFIGASKVQQVDDCAGATRNLNFTGEELARIEQILAE